MSPIEHYFENLLTMGSDIKGEPNKNALSKEVQEAIEICADYIKYNQLLNDTRVDIVNMLEEIKTGINYEFHDDGGYYADKDEVDIYIQQRIDTLKGEEKRIKK